MALTKVTKELIQGGLGVDWQATVKTGNFQAVASQGYFVNTTSNQVIVTMPPTASVGDIVSIVDYAGTAQTNNIKITAQSNINGSANDVVINYQRGAVSIIYSGTIQGWVAEFAANDGTDALVNAAVPFTADYLVVAGGGGGNRNNGGGGAGGGLRTSWPGGSGGGGASETALTITPGTNYTVTVGAGGTVGTGSSPYYGTIGNSSVFAGITSIGGGYGGVRSGSVAQRGGDGGSGGGGGNYTASTGGAPGIGTRVANGDTTNQGFNGGTGADLGNYSGAGGGGAGAGGYSSGGGGTGGAGKTVSITGSNITYAGGGSGGANSSPGGTVSGGGGAGSTSWTMVNGTDELGGGAGSGAGAGPAMTGGNGGSGIVVLRYLTTSVASFIVTGTLNTPTPIIDTTYSVLRFTTGTGTITFN